MSLSENTWASFGEKSLQAQAIKALITSGLIFGLLFIFSLVLQPMIVELLPESALNSFNHGYTIISILLAGLVLALQAISVWITYSCTLIMISDSAFYLRSGFFMRTETSTPYRFITNVSEKQGIIDRMLGVSTYIVELASDESDNAQSDHITLNQIDHDLGECLQDFLLDRANMQKMKMTE